MKLHNEYTEETRYIRTRIEWDKKEMRIIATPYIMRLDNGKLNLIFKLITSDKCGALVFGNCVSDDTEMSCGIYIEWNNLGHLEFQCPRLMLSEEFSGDSLHNLFKLFSEHGWEIATDV